MINITISYNKVAEFLETIAGAGYFVTSANVTAGGINYTIYKKEATL